MRYLYLRLMLKTALAYFSVGILLGLAMYLGYGVPSLSWLLRLRTTHAHLVLVGGVLQVIMGVALWMFPRRDGSPAFTPEPDGLRLYLLLNAGTLLRALSEPFFGAHIAVFWFAFSGAILQSVAFFYFISLIWARIRAPKAVSPGP
ncbi:MAG: hypothetical protein V2G42_09165 [bacterium JZ-2024 1]